MPILTPDSSRRLFVANPQLALDHLSIFDDIVGLFDEWEGTGSAGIPAGYTYWGQFIAHDIGARFPLVKRRSSSLDLDSVYGTGWGDASIQLNAANGKYLIGDTTPAGGLASTPQDLFRGCDKQAVIPEPRNEDNLIISQFHLLMQRFHNIVVDGISSSAKAATEPSAVFNQARLVVGEVFRALTISDFLKAVISQEVYSELIDRNHSYIRFPAGQPLPLEFTDAIYRFGHSLVRETYVLNSVPIGIKLAELFELTGPNGLCGMPTLRSDRVVAWEHFFKMHSCSGSAASGARRIDPAVVDGMRTIKPSPGSPEIDIVKKNLRRGIDAQLNSGQHCVKQLLHKFPALENDIGLKVDNHVIGHENEKNRELIKAKGVEMNTPLWLYVLLEAAGNGTNGHKLGPLGSLLVGEAIKNSVCNAASDSAHSLDAEMCGEMIKELRLDGMTEISELIEWILRMESECQIIDNR